LGRDADLLKSAFPRSSRFDRICIEDPFETCSSEYTHDLGTHLNLKGLELHKSSVLSALKTLDTFLLTASEEMLAVIFLFKNNEKSISENNQTTKDQKEDKQSKVHGPKKDDAKATKRDQKEEESKVHGTKKKYPKATKGDVMDSGSDTKGVKPDDENGAEKSRKSRRRRGKSKPFTNLSEKKKLQIANRKAEAKKRREARLSKGTSIEAV